ncbi:recombinase family protein [Enterococcus faecalis]|nr:recombinase family protein [Enterococcus faecalis]HBI1555849.1 recombinase family protein [Enterococcus faecalis]HBI1558912.1 recombinase family protein [Enterococcus faecalis]HBI1567805.1 recombinase family protein [Enterococcus faecalis]
MAIIGYARVSTTYQQLDSQLLALNKFGCEKIYTEVESGRNTQRSVLSKVIKRLKEGDTFVIFKLDRLSRGTKHLLELMDYFQKKGIHFISIQNNIDTSTSIGRFFFTIMGAFAEMEAELIRERVLAGLDAAKQNGKTLCRPAVNKNIELVLQLYQETDLSIQKIAQAASVSRPTVYRYLRKKNIPLRS